MYCFNRNMRIIIFSLTLLLCTVHINHAYEDQTLEDDDFAEFEQFEVEDEVSDEDLNNEDVPVLKPKLSSSNDKFGDISDKDEIIVEDEDSEFEHFHDPEEFEGYQETTPKSAEQPQITISQVPIMVRPHWDSYWLEGILCCMLAAYALSYAYGRAKNTSIATNFLKLHRPLLDENFTLVGESGLDVVAPSDERGWRREAEHCFTMWCSGRQCCEGMLLTLKLIKRQDLVHRFIGVVRPTPDTLLIRVEFGKDDSDPYVLCIAQKKFATRLAKEMQDLSMFCPEKRPGEKHGLPSALLVLSECAEATAGLLDARVTAALGHFHKNVQYIHVSDRFCGSKQLEENANVATKPPEMERVMLVSLALGPDGGGDEIRPLLLLVFYLLDKIKRLRLSKEALSKCEKRRQKAAEAWVRGSHAARQEQAALRREEKRKQEKEKILAEDDPEKQRRWELKEQKRQQKRKAPKMKQLKVKAL